MTSVSIVIPCKNEQNYIQDCVNSFRNQSFSGDIEILICDGLSSDGTVQKIKDISISDSRVKLLINENETTPYALNLGINHSKGDVVIIFGAHAVADKDYITNCIETFKNSAEIGCVGGVINNVFENKTAEIIAGVMSSPAGVGGAHFRTGLRLGYVDTVAFGAYKREVFETIGLFDSNLARNQDDEFNYRVTKAGYKIYLSPDIKSDYYVRGSLKKLYKQYFQYGYWKVVVNKKHKTVTTFRQLIPAFFVLFLLLGGVLSFVHEYIAWSFLSIIILYFTVILFESLRNNPSRIPQSVLCFLILHLSYGSGYLWALVNWGNLETTIQSKYKSLSR